MNPTRREIARRLEAVPLFARCSGRDLKAVARHLAVVDVASGVHIVEQDGDGDAVFLLLEGSVNIVRDGDVVASLGEGEYFGELALLDPGPRSAAVVTATPVKLAALTNRMFSVVIRDMPQITERLLASMARQLRDARASGHNQRT